MDKEDYTLENRTPDPIAVQAAKEAVEATEPQIRHPWVGKFIVFAVVALLLVGAAGLILSTLNTIQGAHQNAELTKQNQQLAQQNRELHKQQVCITRLLHSLTKETQARAQIAGDDREALRHLVRDVARAKGDPLAVEAAFDRFNKASRLNDMRRAKYPIPIINESVCFIIHTKIPFSSPDPSPSPTKSAHQSKKPGAGKDGKSTAQAGGNPVAAPTRTSQPQPNRSTSVSGPSSATSTHAPQPSPTHSAPVSRLPSSSTASQPAPKPSSSPAPRPSSSSPAPPLTVVTSAACDVVKLPLVCPRTQ